MLCPTVECNNCLIDNIRFHPIDAPFMATVYEDNKITDDDLTVTSPGSYEANFTIDVANFTLRSGQELLMSAGEIISFAPNTTIEPGASLQVRTGDFSVNMNKTIANLGANGEVYRSVYNGLDLPIATVGPDEELRSLNISYSSREGIDIFGDSDPGDSYFDQNHPNMGMHVTAREAGVWEGFEMENNSAFNTLNNMSVATGLLVTLGQGSATFGQNLSAKDYALYTELLPQNLSSGQQIGINIDQGTAIFVLESNAIKLKSQTNELKSAAIQKVPDHLSLLLVVMDGKHLFAYANGRFLFDHEFSQDLQGTVQLVSDHPGGAFDNFMLLEDPIIGKNTYDALGPTQTNTGKTRSQRTLCNGDPLR